jgi:seryl-tRNA synthetase
MLDHNLFVTDAAQTQQRLTSRGVEPSATQALDQLVEARRDCIGKTEALRQQLNQASAELGQKARSGDTQAIDAARGALKACKAAIKEGEETLTGLEDKLQQVLMTIPNLPDAAVPTGKDELSNVTVKTVGTPPKFAFEPKSHWELVENLGIVSFEQAAKLSGARFAVYRGAGARLERALAQLMLDMARREGYLEIAPPLLVRPQTMEGAGQYPKFRGEAFETQDGDFALIPTSEVPLVNLHRDEVLDADALPLRYTALTPCFRREAGSAGKDTRGLIRQHQFHKVELVALVAPEHSADELLRIRQHASSVLDALGLAYQVKALCTGDLGFSATQTFDLEVWLPGQASYREISSCSNCGDFQARRAKIRYRPQNDGGKGGKPRLVHTLNGSALAVGRTFVAVVENYQQADGSIRVPDALVPYFGADVITSAMS